MNDALPQSELPELGDPLPRIPLPELFFGFVAPIGTDTKASLDEFSTYFKSNGYEVVRLKVTDVFSDLAKYIVPTKELNGRKYDLLRRYIEYGNQLRTFFKDDAILAALTIMRILQNRLPSGSRERREPTKTAYLLYQFKRREEIDLLRSVYGRCFFQVSVYSQRSSRVTYLSKSFGSSEGRPISNEYRSKAEEIVQIDENEVGDVHGQRVASIFHDGDVIINSDVSEKLVRQQVYRFCELIFGSNRISPTKYEYGMFAAKAAALRSLDLSRQVGAAIFSERGEVIAVGSNEVPRGAGGTYWCDDPDETDDREYVRGIDTNEKRKLEILSELLRKIGITEAFEDVRKRVKDTQFMGGLEYGRMIHAEMSAITDAARLGIAVKGATLFSTTFPCHLCAKHIVSSGINRVVFLEPYPKSLALELHDDSIIMDGSERERSGKYKSYPATQFSHFHGVSPRRYRELFERSRRKTEDGKFSEYIDGVKRPVVDLKFPFYVNLEEKVLEVYGAISTELVSATRS